MALSLFKKYTAAKTIILVLLTMVFTSPAFAQVGLPIVSMVEDGSGGEKYSLTLQLIALMTVLNVTAIATVNDDLLC